MSKWIKEIIVRYDDKQSFIYGNTLGEVVGELVRCKDCKYLEVHGKTTMYYWCDQWEHYTDEDSFCANSEVRDE